MNISIAEISEMSSIWKNKQMDGKQKAVGNVLLSTAFCFLWLLETFQRLQGCQQVQPVGKKVFNNLTKFKTRLN